MRMPVHVVRCRFHCCYWLPLLAFASTFCIRSIFRFWFFMLCGLNVAGFGSIIIFLNGNENTLFGKYMQSMFGKEIQSCPACLSLTLYKCVRLQMRDHFHWLFKNRSYMIQYDDTANIFPSDLVHVHIRLVQRNPHEST